MKKYQKEFYFSKPIDTSKEEDQLMFNTVAVLSGMKEAIDAQESHGQASFIHSDTLPNDICDENKAKLESIGFIFHGVVPNDDIFQYVTMPKGWKKVRSDEFRFTDLLDDKGRRRGFIFYDSRPIGRNAYSSFIRRISLVVNDENQDENYIEFLVKDYDDSIIHAFEPIKLTGDPRKDYDTRYDNRPAVCLQWLDENFPDYKNFSSYWDKETLILNNG